MVDAVDNAKKLAEKNYTCGKETTKFFDLYQQSYVVFEQTGPNA